MTGISFTCHCGNTGAERTPNKSQHRKLNVEKKILPPPMPDSNSQHFGHKSGVYLQAISAPTQYITPKKATYKTLNTETIPVKMSMCATRKAFDIGVGLPTYHSTSHTSSCTLGERLGHHTAQESPKSSPRGIHLHTE